MKVLHVITGLNDGGAEAVLFRLIVGDAGDAHQVLSLTDMGKYGSRLQKLGATVTALNMPRGRITWRGLRTFWRSVRASRPDVMQTWMYHADLLGGIIGRLAGIPTIWGVRNSSLDRDRSTRRTIWVARVCAWLSRWVPRRIVVCAEEAKRVHAALGYDANRMTVIPNGYDLLQFAPDAGARRRLRTEWGVAPGCPVLGTVARFDPQKDHRNLIDALSGLQRTGATFVAVLVGTSMDADNTALVGWIRQVGLMNHVRLLGPRGDVPAVMSALDVHVLSSAYGEAFPNVLAEAMACGTPCVTTDVGDAARIVGDTGWVVPPRDARALASGLSVALQALTKEAEWQARRQRARQRIAGEFGLDKMVARYRAVWQQAMRRTPATETEEV